MLDLNNMNVEEITISDGIDSLIDLCGRKELEAGWRHDLITGEPKALNIAEQLMLMVSELSEAMEAARNNSMDEKLPHRTGLEVELGDAVIRICAFAQRLDLDLSGAILEKIEYNSNRADHKRENRIKEGGKAW